MRTRYFVVSVIGPVLVVAAACGSSESSDSSGAPGPGGPGASKHEQPPSDDPAGEAANLSEPSGGSGGKGSGGSGGGGNSAGSGNTGAASDAGGPANLPAKCLAWQASQARVELGDTNDTMSATRAREALKLGFAPAPTQVRPRDFFNYYDIDLTGNDAAQTLHVEMQLRARAVPGQYDLLVAVQAPKAPRPRSVFTILVDTTPSMAGIALGRAQLVLRALGGALGPEDSLTVLTTDSSQGVLEPNLQSPQQALDAAADWLDSSSTGSIVTGVKEAYKLAAKHLDPNAQNRVLFISDGAEPPDLLPTDVISTGADNGIRLVGVGTGPTTSYRDRLLGKASLYGRGAYVYVDNEDEAKRSFQAGFDKTFGVSFDDVRIELSLPFFYQPVLEPVSTTSASTGSDPSLPQSLAPGATLAAVVRLEICDPAVLAKYSTQVIVAQVRWIDPATKAELSVPATIPAGPVPDLNVPELDKALAIKAYVQALQSVDKQRVLAALAATQDAKDSIAPATDPDLEEIYTLLKAHPAGNLP